MDIALVLGAAGLLQGKRATTCWLALDELARYVEAFRSNSRFILDG